MQLCSCSNSSISLSRIARLDEDEAVDVEEVLWMGTLDSEELLLSIVCLLPRFCLLCGDNTPSAATGRFCGVKFAAS